MARLATILGIWLTALSLGILGYQGLTYLFYGDWPPVTVAYVWGMLVEPWPAEAGGWLGTAEAWFGRLPLMVPGIAFAYLSFLVADSLPQPGAVYRQPRGN